MGASTDPSRYSNRAVLRLIAAGYSVIPVGLNTGEIGGLKIHPPEEKFDEVDTVSIYLNPKNQSFLYSILKELAPRRVIFNPGAENPALEKALTENKIETMEACTLVLLSTGQF